MKEEIVEINLSMKDQISLMKSLINNAQQKGLFECAKNYTACIPIIQRGFAELYALTKTGIPLFRVTEMGLKVRKNPNKEKLN